MRLLSAFFCWTACVLLAAPATAATILYTDRAAFELAANPNHLITFDGSAAVVESNPPLSSYQVTFDDLLRFNFDLISGVGWFPGGTSVVMGTLGLSSSGVFLEPVYAFGFDILSPNPSGAITGAGSGFNFSHTFSATQFIGVVSDQPITTAGILYVQAPPPTLGTYVLDNVLVTTVPDEVGTLRLLLLAMVALTAARVSVSTRGPRHSVQ